MRRLELTLPTPAENLALDEALLDWAEDGHDDWEFLRLWESPQPVVVVGRSTRVHQEVNESACREREIPILRRSSGGAAIVAGPGCLMYAVVLSYRLRPKLKDIHCAHCFVLGRLADALNERGVRVAHAGTSDLAIEQGATQRVPGGEQGVSGKAHGARSAEHGVLSTAYKATSQFSFSSSGSSLKFSGNSLRAKRSHLLYHGTLLYNFDLALIAVCLRMPPRLPDYRAGRSHGDFVANLPLARKSLVDAVDAAWPTQGPVSDWPAERLSHLVAERFCRDSWNYEFA